MFVGHRRYFSELEDTVRGIVLAKIPAQALRDFVARWTLRGAPFADADSVLRLAEAPNAVIVSVAWKYATLLPGLTGMRHEARRWLADHKQRDDGFAAANLILLDWPEDLPGIDWEPGVAPA